MTAAEVYAWTLISLARAQRRPGGMFRRVGRYEDRPAIKGSRSQDRRTDRLGRVDRRGHVTVDRLGEQGEPDWSRASVDTMSVRARLARIDRCVVEEPPLEPKAAGDLAACHFPLEPGENLAKAKPGIKQEIAAPAL